MYGYTSVEKEDSTNNGEAQVCETSSQIIEESVGDKGKLTADQITKITQYCGCALKTHKGDVQSVTRAVMALPLISDLVSDHSHCPPPGDCQAHGASRMQRALRVRQPLSTTAICL